MRRPRIPRGSIDVGMQNAWIGRLFPGFSYHSGGGKRFWTGTLRPQRSSPSYKIRIVYQGHSAPRTHVVRPMLDPLPEHVYKDRSLCLFYPPDRDWTRRSLIAKTIIPWTACWLYFYEIWLLTGNWLHDEVPHRRRGRRR